ncbi:MAG: hypothetical protein ACI97A_002293 [Planctomycetota bacterium]
MTNEKSKMKSVVLLLIKICLLVVAFFFVSKQVTWQDTIIEKSGKVHTGKIISGFDSKDAKTLMIEREDGRKRTISTSEVAKRSFGIKTTFAKLSPMNYAFGMLLIFCMYCFGIARWRALLAVQGINASYGRAFRLTFVGFFWNNLMPGMTGGDVPKAVLIAKDSPGRRSEAVSTVIIDRVIGLAALAMLSAVAILSNFSKFREQGYVVFGVLGICLIVFVCFFSRRVRRRLRISDILNKLPLSGILKKLDAAFHGYRSSPKTLVFAIVVSGLAHICNICAVFVFGSDLGMNIPLVTYFAAVPIIFIASSIPLFPGGWGVREYAFITVFMMVGVDPAYKSNLVILSVILGLSMMAWSLLGGIFLFIGRKDGEIPVEMKEDDWNEDPVNEKA